MRNLLAATGIVIVAAGASYAQTTVTTTTEPNAQQQSGNAAAGALGGAAVGAAVAGPVGAAVGLVAGAATGKIATPPQTVTTYVTQHPVQPVELQGQVAQGVVIPNSVTLTPVPESHYAYVYSGNQQVIVDPSTRKVVEVMN